MVENLSHVPAECVPPPGFLRDLLTRHSRIRYCPHCNIFQVEEANANACLSITDPPDYNWRTLTQNEAPVYQQSTGELVYPRIEQGFVFPVGFCLKLLFIVTCIFLFWAFAKPTESTVKKAAKPSRYKRVYFAESDRPKHPNWTATVEENDPAFIQNPCIALELQDISLALQEVFQGGNGPSDPESGVVRYMLHLREARALCCHLLHVLADSGDRVAERIVPRIEEAIQEVAALDDGGWKYDG